MLSDEITMDEMKTQTVLPILTPNAIQNPYTLIVLQKDQVDWSYNPGQTLSKTLTENCDNSATSYNILSVCHAVQHRCWAGNDSENKECGVDHITLTSIIDLEVRPSSIFSRRQIQVTDLKT